MVQAILHNRYGPEEAELNSGVTRKPKGIDAAQPGPVNVHGEVLNLPTQQSRLWTLNHN
jgi:hypothetical protein